MKTKLLLNLLWVTLLTLNACSKGDDPKPIPPSPPPPVNPPPAVITKENEIHTFQFVSFDSSDYHYYVGSPIGGMDKANEHPLSNTYSLKPRFCIRVIL